MSTGRSAQEKFCGSATAGQMDLRCLPKQQRRAASEPSSRCSQPVSLGKQKTTKHMKGTGGTLLCHSTELPLFLQAMKNNHSKFHSSDWNSSHERKNYLQDN